MKKKTMLTPFKAIKQHCLDCSGYSKSEVKNCGIKYCPLYPYRLGTNPNRKGIGNKNGKSNLKRKT